MENRDQTPGKVGQKALARNATSSASLHAYCADSTQCVAWCAQTGFVTVPDAEGARDEDIMHHYACNLMAEAASVIPLLAG